jgi:hypothetical protein
MRARLRVASTLGLHAIAALCLTGCERLLSIHDPVVGDARNDGPGIDGALPAGSPLLLSEVVLTPDAGEMIEIVNTSGEDVNLETYYLSDNGNYYRMPRDMTVDTTDFIVKFPTGAVIKGHTAVTVAIDTPNNFFTTYNVLPTYSLRDGSLTTIAMTGTPNLTNAGEPIILFQWDGHSDLVRDVDILLAGIPSATNSLPNKSGVMQDGPDADGAQSAYAVDARTMPPQAMAAAGTTGAPLSTKRIALEDNHETQDGHGNGPSGHDETSEDTSVTWDDGSVAHPFTAPTPGDAPAQLMR